MISESTNCFGSRAGVILSLLELTDDVPMRQIRAKNEKETLPPTDL